MIIKTYVMNQTWDDELQANVYKRFADDRAPDDAKPPTGFDLAGEQLDKMARQVMQKLPGTSYKEAFEGVLKANPKLAEIYGGTK